MFFIIAMFFLIILHILKKTLFLKKFKKYSIYNNELFCCEKVTVIASKYLLLRILHSAFH